MILVVVLFFFSAVYVVVGIISVVDVGFIVAFIGVGVNCC